MAAMTDPSEFGEFGDEAGIRPEVAEALLRALKEEDSAKLAELEAAGISPDERKRAQFLFHVTIAESRLDREAEVWHLLIARQWSSTPTLEELFDDLTPGRAAQLGELYDVLPDAVRAEYDRRYGPPAGT
jgi:ATP phosphoribosyltransferase regulatory subunit HisZ